MVSFLCLRVGRQHRWHICKLQYMWANLFLIPKHNCLAEGQEKNPENMKVLSITMSMHLSSSLLSLRADEKLLSWFMGDFSHKSANVDHLFYPACSCSCWRERHHVWTLCMCDVCPSICSFIPRVIVPVDGPSLFLCVAPVLPVALGFSIRAKEQVELWNTLPAKPVLSLDCSHLTGVQLCQSFWTQQCFCV